MKIAITIEQFNPKTGGQERSTFEVAQLLSDRGIDVTIVAANAENFPADARCKLLDLNIQSYSRVKKFNHFIDATNDLFKGADFDLVHAITPVTLADAYQPRGGLVAEIFARNLDRYTGMKRWLRKLNGPNPRQTEIRRLEEHLAKHTSCTFLALSDYVKRQCRLHLQLPEDRIKTIFNGVDLKRLPSDWPEDEKHHIRNVLNVSDEQLLAVFVATNFKLKGMDLVIESAALLREQHPDKFANFKCLVAGPDKTRNYFKKIEKLNLTNNIIFMGRTDNIAELFHTADLLLHPTKYDPCSRVVLEAMACGLPAISTSFNGASELLEKTNSGLVINDPTNPNELLDCIVKMFDNENRKRFSKNGIASRPQISMDSHVDKLVNFYRTLITQKNKNL